jgi:tetratricopeptide (TPR) repeat protein
MNDAEQQIKAHLSAKVDRADMATSDPSSTDLALARRVVVALGLILLLIVYVFGVHFSKSHRNDSATQQLVDLLNLLVGNWAIVIFVGTLLVAFYVQIGFGADYFFETFRNAYSSKKLSRFYERMGDRMMAISEWAGAEEAYNNALKINQYNAGATRGVAKAQVFKPVEGEKISTEEVIDARLAELLGSFRSDHHIHFLIGWRCEGRERYKEAKASYEQSIKLNADFMGAHLGLGNIAMAQSDLGAAKVSYAKAIDLEPNSAVANNCLGACHMRLSNFSDATQNFEISYNTFATALIASALGEAYWFSRNFKLALAFHQYAADYLNANPDLQDRYTGGGWRAGFLPLRPGDLETGKKSVPLYTAEQKKTLLHFELAIGHALLGDLASANQEFEVASKLQPSPEIRHLAQNRLEAVLNMVEEMSDATKTWLANHRDMLD